MDLYLLFVFLPCNKTFIFVDGSVFDAERVQNPGKFERYASSRTPAPFMFNTVLGKGGISPSIPAKKHKEIQYLSV